VRPQPTVEQLHAKKGGKYWAMKGRLMKHLAIRTSRQLNQRTERDHASAQHVSVLGSIPGLERLLPGHYRPGVTVRSRYGTWILPRSFRGRRLCAIIDGTLFG
jgi:hypothetical protein